MKKILISFSVGLFLSLSSLVVLASSPCCPDYITYVDPLSEMTVRCELTGSTKPSKDGVSVCSYNCG